MISKNSIAKNSAYSLLSTLAQKALTLVYFIIVARVFGPHDQGSYSAALAFATLFGVLIDLGLSSSLVRETARFPERAGVFLGHMFVVRTVLSIVVYAFIIGAAVLIGYSEDLIKLIAIAGLATCIDVVSTSCWSILRGFQNLLYESIGGVIAIVVMMAIGLSAMILHLPVSALVFAVLAGSFANFLYVLYLLKVRAKLPLSFQFDKTTFKYLFLMTLPFAGAALFSRIYTFSDTALLAKFAGEAHAGYYSAGNKLILALNMIPAAISSSIFPAMSSSFLREPATLSRTYGRAHLYLLLLALPMTAGTVLLADELILFFYGPTYGPTAGALVALAPSLLFGFLMFPLGALLAATNRQHVNTVIFGIAAVLNVGANLVLIPLFFSTGSAYASALSSTTIFLLSFCATWRQWIDQKKFLLVSFGKILIATAIMSLFAYAIQDKLHVVGVVALSILLYGGTVLLLKIIPKEDIAKLRPWKHEKDIARHA